MKFEYNKKQRIKGIARDAKNGAVLLAEDNVIYIGGLDFWPSEVEGKVVTVSGILRKRKMIPDPINEKGEICTGAWGEQDILEDAKWKIEKDKI
ncbi:MAG: hypothetical protein QXT63_05185 [Thermoplasmata archaeon]